MHARSLANVFSGGAGRHTPGATAMRMLGRATAAALAAACLAAGCAATQAEPGEDGRAAAGVTGAAPVPARAAAAPGPAPVRPGGPSPG